MKWLRSAVAEVLLGSALGCGTVVHGHVTAMTVDPGVTVLTPLYVGKTMLLMPMDFPETYDITVTGPDSHGKVTSQTIYIDASEYRGIHIGDIYDCGQKVQCVTERPHK
jgi:hypothetical protein